MLHVAKMKGAHHCDAGNKARDRVLRPKLLIGKVTSTVLAGTRSKIWQGHARFVHDVAPRGALVGGDMVVLGAKNGARVLPVLAMAHVAVRHDSPLVSKRPSWTLR
jgi:hypothetical protein